MKLFGKDLLIKYKKKIISNQSIVNALNKLVNELEEANWTSKADVVSQRTDADLVHPDGFFIFNIKEHRTLILIAYSSSTTNNDGNAQIIWIGDHIQYELLFNNNRNTIKKWLRNKGYVE